MNYFNLLENIYFIKGTVKSSLYNSNTGDIFWMSKDSTKLISLLVKKGLNCDKLPISYNKDETKKFLNNLEKNSIGYFCSDWHPYSFSKPKANHNISIVWYEVTKKCNLRCLHCYNNSSPAIVSSDELLSIEKELNILHDIGKVGVKRFQFIGGEPFLCYEKLKILVPVANKYFDKIEIFTNGTLIDKRDDIFSFLIKYNITIALSLYSIIPEIHDKITGIKGSHRKTLNAISMLKKKNIPFKVSNIIMNYNYESIEETKDYLYEHFGIKLFSQPVRMSGRADIALINEKIIRNKQITLDRFKLPINFSNFCQNNNYHNCYGKKLYIANNGNVYPCVMDREIILGNLLNNNFGDIIHSKIYYDCISMNKDFIMECRDCEFRYYCHDCRPDANFNQSYFAKPWNCTYLPYSGEWQK